MVLPWVIVWTLLAALASWRLALKQRRDAWRWTIATVLLGGLPVLWLVIHELLGRPATVEQPVRRECCDRQSWTAVADLGHAGGVDLDLGRCANCGTYLMAVFYVTSTNYVTISREQAEHFLSLRDTPELKPALKRWVG